MILIPLRVACLGVALPTGAGPLALIINQENGPQTYLQTSLMEALPQPEAPSPR